MAITAPVAYLPGPSVDQVGRFPARSPVDDAPRFTPTRDSTRARSGRSAAVLDFPSRVVSRFDGEADFDQAAEAYPTASARFADTRPTSAYVAQYIAQERLSDGLTLDRHAAATRAYASSDRLTGSGARALDIAV